MNQPAHVHALPHPLTKAHEQLVNLLKEGIGQFSRNLRYSNGRQICLAIERFVHELFQKPVWEEELRRRSNLVAESCGAGTAYDEARKAALSRYRGRPRKLSGAKLAIQRLRTKPRNLVYLSDVDGKREDIETILHGRVLGLRPAAVDAFGRWRDALREIQWEAQRLEVDGCRQLYHVYLAASREASQDAISDRYILERTSIGGVWLDRILEASDSLIAWAYETLPVSVEKTGETDTTAEGPAKWRWTQPKVNDAIRTYKVQRIRTYRAVAEDVSRGRRQAVEAAREIFGRNRVATALAAPQVMVSKSPVWQQIKRELGLGRRRVSLTASRLESVIEGCGFRRLSDFTASAVQAAVAAMREKKSLRTCNGYLRAVKGFSRWAWHEGRLASDPLASLQGYNEQTDRRRVRRAICADEFARLIDAAEAGPEVEGIPGPDRAMMYVLSAWTGFRRRELSSLSLRSFDLDRDPPTVTVQAAHCKRRRTDTQPLHPVIVERLSVWLDSKPALGPDECLFPLRTPGGWWRKTAKIANSFLLRKDRTGIFVLRGLAETGRILIL